MKRQWLAAVAVTMSASGVALPVARAGLVTFSFEGEVTKVGDYQGVLGDAVDAGSLFSGTYTFESLTPDGDPDSSTYGTYFDAVVAVSGDVGAASSAGPLASANSIRCHDNAYHMDRDIYAVYAHVELLGIDTQFTLHIWDDDGEFLQDDHLLTVPPDLALAETKAFNLGPVTEAFRIDGVIREMSVVPEPTALASLTLGLCLVSRRKRRPRSLIRVVP